MEELAKEPVKITSYLAESLPAQSTFFICYIMLRSFTGLSLELLRVVDLIVIPVKRRWFCYTPREDEAAWRPPPILYDRVVCHCTFRLYIVLPAYIFTAAFEKIRIGRYPQVLCFYSDSTAARLAQLGERRSAERDTAGSNPGRNKSLGLKITK